MPGPKHDPLWRPARGIAALTPLDRDLEVDVAIVGAGITGLTTAALLHRAGRRVAVLEARHIGAGCTGHSTGHLSQLLDTRFSAIRKRFGGDAAVEVRRAVRDAIDLVGRLVDVHRVRCGYRRLPGYLFTEREADIRELEKEHEAALEAGQEAALVSQTPLPFPVRLALRLDHCGQFDPLAYVTGLADSLQQAGVTIHTGTRVEDVEGGAPCHVHTPQGTVRAGAVVLATHSPIGIHHVHFEMQACSSYAIALQLRDAKVPEGLFWDTASPYHYLTRHPRTKSEYLVIGGADHKTGAATDLASTYTALESYARARFPLGQITHRWSFDYFEPADGLPYVGRALRGEGIYLATGFTGDGLVLGPAAARVLTDHLTGREPPYGDVFESRRLELRAGGRNILEENLKVVGHFVRDRIDRPAGDPADLQPGQGSLLMVDGEKVAAYRDDAGTLHLLSPVCTHARCIVHWNQVESTWDCPCHGGRYTPLGEVISGPPMKPLGRKEG